MVKVSLILQRYMVGLCLQIHLLLRSTDSLHPALLQPFLDLKRVLASALTLNEVDPNEFLSPFLDVIRSESVTGPVTGQALAAVNKFLAYGLLDPDMPNIASAVENLTDAVTHARQVGLCVVLRAVFPYVCCLSPARSETRIF